METQIVGSGPLGHPYVYALGAVTGDGKKRLLLVSKRERPFDLSIPSATGATVERVDQATAFDPPASARMSGETLRLGGSPWRW